MVGHQCLARIEWLVVVGVIVAAGAVARAEDLNIAIGAVAQADDLPALRRRMPDMTLLVDDAPPAAPERWIGVVCTPASDPLRAQLKIAQGQGLLVREVVPDSPAFKAGLQRNDIVLTANDKPLDRTAALVAAVLTAGDEGLNLKILREGGVKSIRVQPTKRPENQSALSVPMAEPYMELLRPLIENSGGLFSADTLRLRRIAPGISVWTAKPLPDDVSITIKKKGDNPAQITVQQGDKKWEITEDDLEKLPAKVRTYVISLVHRIADVELGVAVPEEVQRRLGQGLGGVMEGLRRRFETRSRVKTVPEAFERRLKKLERQMNQLMEKDRRQSSEDSELEDQ